MENKRKGNKHEENTIFFVFPPVAYLLQREKDDKTISIGYINWDDGIALTYLTEVILEQQGYHVILKNADPAPIYATMARGKVDLLMDAWLPATQADYMKQYGKNLEILGKIYPDARIGLVVPDYVDIHSIEQLNANKEKFGGEIIGIDAGAGIMHAADMAIENTIWITNCWSLADRP